MEKIKQLLKLVISTLYGVEVEANVVAAPKDTGADFATNIAMSLTKTLKRNPLEIAEEIRGELLRRAESENGVVDNVEVARPGFINIKLGDGFYKAEIGFTSILVLMRVLINCNNECYRIFYAITLLLFSLKNILILLSLCYNIKWFYTLKMRRKHQICIHC